MMMKKRVSFGFDMDDSDYHEPSTSFPAGGIQGIMKKPPPGMQPASPVEFDYYDSDEDSSTADSESSPYRRAPASPQKDLRETRVDLLGFGAPPQQDVWQQEERRVDLGITARFQDAYRNTVGAPTKPEWNAELAKRLGGGRRPCKQKNGYHSPRRRSKESTYHHLCVRTSAEELNARPWHGAEDRVSPTRNPMTREQEDDYEDDSEDDYSDDYEDRGMFGASMFHSPPPFEEEEREKCDASMYYTPPPFAEEESEEPNNGDNKLFTAIKAGYSESCMMMGNNYALLHMCV